MSSTTAKCQESIPGFLKGSRDVTVKLKKLWLDFFVDTSLHGCNNIPRQQRSKIIRVLWTIIVVMMTIALISTLVQLYAQYYSYRFQSKVNRYIRQTLQFPAVTVCNTNTVDTKRYKPSNVEVKYMRANGDLVQYYPPIDWEGEDGEALNLVDAVKMRDDGSFRSEDMLKLTLFSDEFFNTSYWQRTVLYQNQVCFTFNSILRNRDRKPINIEKMSDSLVIFVDTMQERHVSGVSVREGLRVFIHDPTMPPGEQTTHLHIPVGAATRVELHQREMTFLGPPYNSGGSECIDAEDPHFVNPLDWYAHYSLTGCKMECANKHAISTCNCTLGWEPDSAIQWTNGTKCSCPINCRSVSYEVQTSFMKFPSANTGHLLASKGVVPSMKYAQENMLLMHIVFGSMMVENTTHVPQLELADIFARLGGQMSLFLGASIITTMEVFELLASTMYLLVAAIFHKKQVRP